MDIRKKLLVIMTSLMLVSLTGCTTKKDTNISEQNKSTEKKQVLQTEPDTSTEDASVNEGNIDLIYTFKDPSYPVAFDYPNIKLVEEGTSMIFKKNNYLVIYCRDSKQAELNNVVAELTKKFQLATTTYLNGEFDSFTTVYSESKTINDTEVLMVEGAVVTKYDDGSSIELPMYGYTFSKGDVICEILGVLNERTDEVQQEDMEKTVDAMIATLRDDR